MDTKNTQTSFAADKSALTSAECAALEGLILRLKQTPLLSRENENRKYKMFIENIADRMINEGVSRGVAADDHEMYNQPEDEFFVHLQSVDNELLQQISIFNFGLDRWFEYGECHPPYLPWRIAIILSKRKELEKEKRFLAAYCRHFKFRVGTRDQKITNRAIKKGAISSDGIPSKEEIVAIAANLIREHGYNARVISDNTLTKAYESGLEDAFLYADLIRQEVIRQTVAEYWERNKISNL